MYLLSCIFLLNLIIINAHFKIVEPMSRLGAGDGGAIRGQSSTNPNYCGNTQMHADGNPITTVSANSGLLIKWRIINDHQNSPMRISLSRDGAEVYDCVLLNNIPHPTPSPQDANAQSINMQWTWNVPNIVCALCTLHIEWFHGTGNNGQGSCQNDTSPGINSNIWKSCADIVITNNDKKRVNRNSYTCYQPTNWPQRTDNCEWFRTGTSATSWSYDVGTDMYTLIEGADDDILGCPYSTPKYNQGVNKACNADPPQPILFHNDLIGSVPFAYGGTMNAGGVLAIILLIAVAIIIAVVVVLKKKGIKVKENKTNKNQDNEEQKFDVENDGQANITSVTN